MELKARLCFFQCRKPRHTKPIKSGSKVGFDERVRLCLSAYVQMCVCVCERERDRERDPQTNKMSLFYEATLIAWMSGH